jgi:lipopolysaccharide export system permease protein
MRDNYAALLLEEGVFNTPVDKIAVYVGERAADGTLKGILVHDSRVKEKPVTWMAKSGKIVKMGNSVRFLLENASSQQINRSNGEVRILYFDSYPFDISIYAGSAEERLRKKDERYLSELFNPEPNISEKDRARFYAEGHERIIWPLYNLVLPLFAIGIMLSGDFNRRGQAKRILIVVAISVSVIIGGFATKNIVARSSDAFAFIMYIPLLGGSAFAAYSLLSAKRIQFKSKLNFASFGKGA